MTFMNFILVLLFRMSAKLAFSVLMESAAFDTQLKRHVPADTLRHVQKAMKAITTKS